MCVEPRWGGGLCTAPSNPFILKQSNVCRTKVGGGLCNAPLNLSNVCRANSMGWGEVLKPIFDLCRINARGSGRFV